MTEIFNTLLDILREDEHFHEEIPYLGENIVYHGDVNDISKTAESLQMACDMLKVPHIKVPVTFYAEKYQTYESECVDENNKTTKKPIIDKLLIRIHTYNAEMKKFEYTIDGIFRYNHHTKSFYYQHKGSKWLPVRVNDTFSLKLMHARRLITNPDIAPFKSVHPLMTEDPFVKMMIKLGYYTVADYIKEIEQVIADNHSWINGDDIYNHVNLTWTELMQAKSMKEIKSTRWARIQKLNVNKGKLNVFQLNAVKNIRPYITLEFTERILQMLRENKIMYSTNPHVFMQIILYQGIGINARLGGLLVDTMNMAKQLKRRLDFNKKTSYRSIQNLHNELSALLDNNSLRNRYSGENDILHINEQYQPLIDVIDKRSNMDVIRTASGLLNEGNYMHHCVGSYISAVNRGRCIIVRALIGSERVTMELYQDKTLDKFLVRQVQMKYNAKPLPETYQVVFDMLNEVNGEVIDYNKYMSTYHAPRRNEELREIELERILYRKPIFLDLIYKESPEESGQTLDIEEINLPF